MTQRTQQLCDSGRRDEALQAAADAKRRFVDFNNEIEEIVTHLQHRGLKAYGIETVAASTEKMRKDIDLLATLIHES